MTTSDPLPPPVPAIAQPVAPIRRPFPTIGQAVLLTLMLIGAQLTVGGLLGIIGQVAGLSLAQSMGAGMIGIGNVLSFVDTQFSEKGFRSRLHGALAGVREVDVQPLDLRRTFTTLARAAQAEASR